MATDLRDRLGDLAAHTPPGSPPADLWQRGVRRRRLARAGSLATVAALVALLGIGGWSWRLDHARVEPAAPQGAPHLPDRFYTPSPWLPAFDGPPGQLVAVGLAERKSLFHTTEGAYGITASTGTYGFLDLPGLYPDPQAVDSSPAVALSPDGRRLAYWVAGPVPARDVGGAAIGGLAVRDLVTGSTRTWRVGSARGLSPSFLGWSDDDTLVLAFGHWMAGSSQTIGGGSTGYRNYAWFWGDARPHLLADQGVALESSPVTTLAAFGRVQVGESETGGFWLLDPRNPNASRHIRGMGGGFQTAVSPDGTRAVRMSGPGSPSPLTSYSIPPVGSRVVARPDAPLGLGRRVYNVVTWADDDHAVVIRRGPKHGEDYQWPLTSIDVRSGRSTTIIDPYQEQTLAIGLLSAPSASATPPPSPWDRRWVAGALVFGLAGCLLLLWRLRGRRA